MTEATVWDSNSIKALRISFRDTQARFAARIGRNVMTIIRLEQGISAPSLATMRALDEAQEAFYERQKRSLARIQALNEEAGR